jgi:hypothetical protein
MLEKAGKIVPVSDGTVSRPNRLSYPRLFLALGLAAASDAISFWTVLLPPVQWAIDLATAVLLYIVLGRRWALLPGLIAEAIPGMGVFPVWVLVVLSIFLYDDIKARRKSDLPATSDRP